MNNGHFYDVYLVFRSHYNIAIIFYHYRAFFDFERLSIDNLIMGEIIISIVQGFEIIVFITFFVDTLLISIVQDFEVILFITFFVVFLS